MRWWPFKRKDSRYPELKNAVTERRYIVEKAERKELDDRLNYIRQEIAVIKRGR